MTKFRFCGAVSSKRILAFFIGAGIAGLPTPAATILSVAQHPSHPDTIRLTWPSRTGKVYALESSSTLQDAFAGQPYTVQSSPPVNTWWISVNPPGEPLFLRLVESDPGSFSGPRAAAHRLNARLGAGNNFMAAKSMFDNGSSYDYHLLNRHHFNHCRIGFKMDEVVGPEPDYQIPFYRLQSLQQMVDWCLAEGLIAVIDPVHNWANNNDPSQEYEDTPANRQKLQRIWEQVAAHFAAYSLEDVVFEIMNEPHGEDGVTTIIQIGLAAIRGTPGNEKRIVIVSGDGFSTRQALIDAFDKDEIPADDPYLIATFHYYDPRDFTKQGNTNISWGTHTQFLQTGIDFDEVIAANKAFASRHGTDPLPLYLGEFGVDNGADNWHNDRERWLSWIRMQAEARGFSWAHWNMYNNRDSSKGMGPWTSLQRNDPQTRSFDFAPLVALIGRYECESADFNGSAMVAHSFPGYTGTGYAALPDESASVSVSNIYTPRAQTYRVQIHYASPLDCTVRLNTGAQNLEVFHLPATGSYASWNTAEVLLDFDASISAGSGIQSLNITSTSSPGPNVDWIHLTAPRL